MRIRTIKPEFWRSDDITRLAREDRLLFIGLWSYVDDNGVGLDDYRAISADLFALEDDQKEVREYVREGLATLSRALLIDRYEVDGKRYIHIRTWKKHQRVDRPNKARYPLPPEGYTPPTSGPDEPSRHPRDTLATVSPPGTEEQGNRGTGKNLSSANADAPADEPATPPREDVEALCTRLADRVEANGARRPTITKRWRDAARLLIDRDLATEPDPVGLSERLIDWAAADEFWSANVLSMPTFRAKFDQLRMKARRDWERKHRTPDQQQQSRTSTAMAATEAAFAEWRARRQPTTNVLELRPAEGA